MPVMRVAALYDIHANLPALEAVLQDVRAAQPDLIVVGGDVLPGPMPRETLALLQELDVPPRYIHGNGELAVLAQIGVDDPNAVTYWGTTSGAPLPEPLREVMRWTAQQVHPEYDAVLRGWPKTLRIEIGALGTVLFCHGTPEARPKPLRA
jgi:3',5'-cyclic AMP phosphodiesterase CpdA